MSKFGSPYSVIVPKTAAFTYDPTQSDGRVDLIQVDASAGAVVITVPDPALLNGAEGLDPQGNDHSGQVRIIKTDATGNPVTITPAAGSIFGNTILRDQYASVHLRAANGNWWAFGAAQRLFEAEVALSSAQILALNATPVELVPAPGSGKVVIVRGITLKMVATATAYANGGALEFRYTNASGAKVTADIAAAVVTAGAGTSYTSVAGVTTSLTNVVNSPIVVNNATAPFITGTGTAVVGISFEVLEL